MRQKPEEGIHDGVDGESDTTLKIQFTNGNLLTGETTATTVSAKVLKGETDITPEYAASAFVWTRDTGDAVADATWNAAHNGVKQFTMNAADLTDDVKLTCTLTGTSTDYGTVYVDEDMNLIHAPAEADANDTLHLENGILSVETEGNEYQLNGNVLGVARQRLNGSVTAEAWVYTAAPEKLVEFKYDSDGLRTQKKVTDHGQVVTTDYIYHGKQLAVLICGNDTLHFFYDAQGRPAQVECNGEKYLYISNLQGDILQILDSDNRKIVSYVYGTYGKRSIVLCDNHSRAAALNPLAYRSNVYDQEASLYYLQSRYYSHELARFVNIDKEIDHHKKLLSNNTWAYCRNAPVLLLDQEGNEDEELQELYNIINEKTENGIPEYLFDEKQYKAAYSEYTFTIEEEVEQLLKDIAGQWALDKLYDVLIQANGLKGTAIRLALDASDTITAQLYENNNPDYQPGATYRVRQVVFISKIICFLPSYNRVTYSYIERIDGKGTQEAIIHNQFSIAASAIVTQSVLYEKLINHKG